MENLTCFHVASIIFSVLTVIMRWVIVTYVTRKRVYRYGRGLRRGCNIWEGIKKRVYRYGRGLRGCTDMGGD
jgi:hypothetical protein